MRILPHLMGELGDHMELVVKYELIAELADGRFGFGENPYETVVFFAKRMKSDLVEKVIPKAGQCGVLDAMDMLVERVMTMYRVSQNEVKMRLALRGEPYE